MAIGWFFLGSDSTSAYQLTALDLTPYFNVNGSTTGGINIHGQVVINSGLSAFRYSDGVGLQGLGRLAPQSYNTSGAGINNNGQVTGGDVNRGHPTHAFRYTDGVGMIDLGTLGGQNSSALGINANGQVTGNSNFAATNTTNIHAFLYTNGRGMVDLGTLGGADSSARAINSRGDIVCFSTTSSGAQHAFLWTSGTGMLLNFQ